MRITPQILYDQIDNLNEVLEKDEGLFLRGQNGVWGLFTKFNNGGLKSVVSWVKLREISYFLDGIAWALINR